MTSLSALLAGTLLKDSEKGRKLKKFVTVTPLPRWLYGYTTSVGFQKYWIVKVYAAVVGHFMRLYDFVQAQKVDIFVANSHNVAARIWKFYRRKAIVIYPRFHFLQFLKLGRGLLLNYLPYCWR